MLQQALEDLGLTNAEIKVYSALLELGNTKAGDVIRQTGLQNSVVHMTLQKLVEKGLASFVRHGKVKHYQATNPRNILKWIDEKRQRFEDVLPQLLAKQAHVERQEAEVFEGFRGFKAMCYKFIEDAEPGDEYLFFAFITQSEEIDREVYSFYREFTLDRQRRDILIRGVAHESRKNLFASLGYDLKQIAFVNFPTLQNASIFRNKIILTPWQDRHVGFLLTSHQVASNMRDYFYSIWNHYKKF